jgi:CxxC motif-containing protein (DUF1111 family)
MRTSPGDRPSGLAPLLGGLAVLLVSGAVGAKEPGGDPGLSAAPADGAVKAGRELFARVWVPNDARSHGGDGLGPVFNGQSCLGCHDQGGPGGAGSAERNIEIATAAGPGAGAGGPGYSFSYAFGMDLAAGRFEYKFLTNPPTSASAPARRETPAERAALATIHPGFGTSRSVVLHRFGTDPAYHPWRNAVPGLHGAVAVRTSERNPTPLFGTGLIDAIPDEVIEAVAKRPPGAGKVRGRVSRLADGRIGRFGWKAQTATLREFALGAAATELGLEVPGHHQAGDPRLPGLGSPGLDMDQAESDALVAYVRALPAPVERVPADASEAAQVKAGEATFKSIGCAGCHLPKLGDVEGIYSDLLLHDMSPRLGDTASYGVFVAQPGGADGPAAAAAPRGEDAGAAVGASLQEWRTPPLWGLRNSAPYLHDGRAATVDEAITLHGGHGAPAAQRYAQLTARRKQQLGAFLLSLSAPPREAQRPQAR